MKISKVLFWSTVGGVGYYFFKKWLETEEGSGGTHLGETPEGSEQHPASFTQPEYIDRESAFH